MYVSLKETIFLTRKHFHAQYTSIKRSIKRENIFFMKVGWNLKFNPPRDIASPGYGARYERFGSSNREIRSTQLFSSDIKPAQVKTAVVVPRETSSKILFHFRKIVSPL